VAPEGIFGGEPGAPGSFTVNGEPVRTQSRFTLQPGDHVRLDLPGGGGYGPPNVANSQLVPQSDRKCRPEARVDEKRHGDGAAT
jgi:N-methylhydantoinase B/oxoprolinase/acetone carboxylase alpha subunit